MINTYLLFCLAVLLLSGCDMEQNPGNTPSSINRREVVGRHNVKLTAPDTLGSLSVGNGEFAFTVDVSGLQTFPEAYANGIALGTQAQWGWHSFPNEGNYTIADVAKNYASCNDKVVPYAVQHDEGRAAKAAHYLRTNPHRLHLGLIGLVLLKENGEEVELKELQNIEQELDLWSGKITSRYSIEGVPVQVTLYSHPDEDQISAQIQSSLLGQGRIKVKFRFPYGDDCHVCPGYNFSHPDQHQSQVISQEDNQVLIERTLDTNQYFVLIRWSDQGAFNQQQPHTFSLSAVDDQETLSFSVSFDQQATSRAAATFAETQQESTQAWESFWSKGGFMDFSDCTDPRATELERRVILSQYLTRIQCAGSLPPQETGLTMNSWYGKFHLEMHWWHGVHFPLWDRADLLEKSMGWYPEVMDKARETAQWQGYQGVRWQKMTGPEGLKSPSSVGELLAWQQPHPIYFAELLYRDQPGPEVLARYKEMVFETADFMASFVQFNEQDQQYHLCHPLIPAQEIMPAESTDDPPFELAYWHYALSVAQQWRQRLGMQPHEQWQNILQHLAPLPSHEGLYLPGARVTEAYTNKEYRRDHPIVLGAYGMLPGKDMVDTTLMAHTFETIFDEWQWQTTWGWDYPMIAMAAARLGKPEQAIDALFKDLQKNTYLVNGHNYQDERLRLYLPGNGGLLTAVAMMAAGWDGCPEKVNPGFPDNGKWNVQWEGLKPMP